MARRRAFLPVLTLLPLALPAVVVGVVSIGPGAASARQATVAQRQFVTGVDVRWETSTTLVPGAEFRAVVTVQGRADGARSDLVLRLAGARVRGIPAGCVSSSTVSKRSSVSGDGTTLTCALDPRVGDPQVVVEGVVTAPAGDRVVGFALAGLSQGVLPARAVVAGPPTSPRLLRLLSSPDFLNADVADLHRGPNRWTPSTSLNAINGSYRTSLDTVLDDWRSQDPDAVLVAGDLVDGHWDRDDQHTGTFGPVRTTAQQRQAVRRAAHTFYPQWLERFTSRGLDVYPAIGDHEIGDNPWDAGKRRLVDTYKSQFGHFFTETGGRARFADHPRHSAAAHTSYAFRPVPQVQVVSLDVFDITRARARIGLDQPQLRWLKGVLARAQADGVRWTIVQGHTPILEPVRARGSSQLRVPHGERSALWRTFEKYGVDLYLAGEVHDVTMSEHGGVTQLTHGGLFQYGLTNYALLDVYDDRIDIDLRDYDTTVKRNGRRLWESRAPGLPRQVRVEPGPFTIGTASISATTGLVDRTGYLLPYVR